MTHSWEFVHDHLVPFQVCRYLSILEVVEAASWLFRGSQLLGSHLIPHLALNLLLALLAGLNAMEPATPQPPHQYQA